MQSATIQTHMCNARMIYNLMHAKCHYTNTYVQRTNDLQPPAPTGVDLQPPAVLSRTGARLPGRRHRPSCLLSHWRFDHCTAKKRMCALMKVCRSDFSVHLFEKLVAFSATQATVLGQRAQSCPLLSSKLQSLF